MEFQLSYFKSWKMMLWKCGTQYARKFGKLSSGHRTGRDQFSFESQKKSNAKECSDYCTIALISHASKVMLKMLQARLQQYVNHELPDVQAGFRKCRRTRDKIANIHWITAREFQKNVYFCFIDYTKGFDCVDHSKQWKILQEMGIPDRLTCLLRNRYAGQEATELDVKKQTVSKSGKEYVKAVYCHPAYLIYMQSSVQFSRSVVSNSLRPHEPQHARPPCPSPTPVYPNSCPLSRWCHLTVSSSVFPFSSCPQSFPTSGSFPVSQLFASGGQNIGVSASTSVLPVNTRDWFPLGGTGWISLQSKGLSRVFCNTTVQKRQFFGAQLSL